MHTSPAQRDAVALAVAGSIVAETPLVVDDPRLDDLLGRLSALGWQVVPTFDLDRMRRTLAGTPFAAGIYGSERLDLNEGTGKGHPLATTAQTAEALDALSARLEERSAQAQRQADDLAALRSDVAAMRRLLGTESILAEATSAKAAASFAQDAVAHLERRGQ